MSSYQRVSCFKTMLCICDVSIIIKLIKNGDLETNTPSQKYLVTLDLGSDEETFMNS